MEGFRIVGIVDTERINPTFLSVDLELAALNNRVELSDYSMFF